MNERIRRVREKLNLSQADLGKALGIGRSAVSRIESGVNAVTETNIRLLCQQFGINREWLETGIGEMMAPDPTDELEALAKKYHLRHKDFVLIEKLVNLSPAERDGIFQFMTDVVAASTAYGADPDAAVYPKTVPARKTLDKMTRAEILAEVERQLDEEEEIQNTSPVFGAGSSGTAAG